MKEILTFTKASINAPTNLTLFTAGKSGVMFTGVAATGLTLKAGLASGGVVTLPPNLVGAGLGYGDSLIVTGTGDLLLTMWGELEETYRVNGTALEVLVATPIVFLKSGVVGGVSVVANTAAVIKPGLYTDKAYSLESSTRKVTWS